MNKTTIIVLIYILLTVTIGIAIMNNPEPNDKVIIVETNLNEKQLNTFLETKHMKHTHNYMENEFGITYKYKTNVEKIFKDKEQINAYIMGIKYDKYIYIDNNIENHKTYGSELSGKAYVKPFSPKFMSYTIIHETGHMYGINKDNGKCVDVSNCGKLKDVMNYKITSFAKFNQTNKEIILNNIE